ncbi:hypothetical protein LTR16_002639, partial [Cryomyces antarcticus]
MKFSSTILHSLLGFSAVNGLVIPETVTSLSLRDTPSEDFHASPLPSNPLERRKGGGGSSGGGGGRSSGSSSGSSSSGSSSGGRTSSGASSGGAARTPAYGGGQYYSGGATSPYRSGSRSPLGLTPFLLPIAVLSIFPGLWLYGAYAYPYSHPYSFHNQSAPNNGTNTTLPVQCLCQQYSDCGCDDNTNSTYMDDVLGNGSAADMDPTLVQVAPVNGSQTILINGTLPNDTSAAVASAAAGTSIPQGLLEHSGWWVMGAIVGYTVWF